MTTNEFKTYHPIVNFLYFAVILVFSALFMSPVCLALSLLGSITYTFMLRGTAAVRGACRFALPLVIAAALINAAFNHAGATILAYFPNGNPLTLESVVYGLCAALMLLSVTAWFSCFSEIMTSDKFIYLFGRILPSLSLVLSMTLRFIPLFTVRISEISAAQRAVGRAPSGGVLMRARRALSIFAAMTAYSAESSIDTANSMKSRGYGLPGRTSFSIYRFDKRDSTVLTVITLLSATVICGAARGIMHFSYFPTFTAASASAGGIICYGAYAALCILPPVTEAAEVIRWNNTSLKL